MIPQIPLPQLPAVTLGELQAALPVMSSLIHIVIAKVEGETEEATQARINNLRGGLQHAAILLGCIPQLARERTTTMDAIYAMPVSEGLQLLAQSLAGINALKLHALFQASAKAGELAQAAMIVAAGRGS